MKKIITPLFFALVASTAWSHSMESAPAIQPIFSLQEANPPLLFHAHRQGKNTIELMWRFGSKSNVINL